MTARAESVMGAVATAITGLATTGANVQRGQIYGHQVTDLPALALYMGADSPAAEHQTGLIDWELTIRIESTVTLDSSYTTMGNTLETSLNVIREEIHAALLADHTLGLAYVIDVTPGPAAAPELSGEGNEPIASQALEFIVKYRTTRADIGA